MHKPESVQGDETHEIFENFKIQADLLIPARTPDLMLINKRKRERERERERIFRLVCFAVPANP